LRSQQRTNETFATPQINIDIFSPQLFRASHQRFVLPNQQLVRAPRLSVLQCIKSSAARGRSSATTRPSHSAAIVMRAIGRASLCQEIQQKYPDKKQVAMRPHS
jgi:hypothetical protein